jgi:hypothetical protein
LPARQIVVFAETAEDAINQVGTARSLSERSCDQRHQDDEGNLADVGRFSRHVPSGDDGEASLSSPRSVSLGTIFFDQILIEEGVACVLQTEPGRVIRRRAGSN